MATRPSFAAKAFFLTSTTIVTGCILNSAFPYVSPTRTHSITIPATPATLTPSMIIEARRSPPPIGAIVYPASRLLLHHLMRHSTAQDKLLPVVDVGSGVGLTSIGLSLSSFSVTAVDIDEDVLETLQSNACKNNTLVDTKVLDITAASSLAALPSPAHYIFADLIYHSGATSLPSSLVYLLAASPSSRATIVLVSRFGGPGLSALSELVGVQSASNQRKPAAVDTTHRTDDNQIAAFLEHSKNEGLKMKEIEVTDDVRNAVIDDLPLWERGKWYILGIMDGLKLYEVELDRNVDAPDDDAPYSSRRGDGRDLGESGERGQREPTEQPDRGSRGRGGAQ